MFELNISGCLGTTTLYLFPVRSRVLVPQNSTGYVMAYFLSKKRQLTFFETYLFIHPF